MTRAGLPSPFVCETTGVTPKACTARHEETTTVEKSFMVVAVVERNVTAEQMQQSKKHFWLTQKIRLIGRVRGSSRTQY